MAGPVTASLPSTAICPRYIQFAATSPAWSTRMVLVKVSRWAGLRYFGVSIVDSSSTLVAATYFAEGGTPAILDAHRLVIMITLARLRTRTAAIPWKSKHRKKTKDG